MSDTASLVLGYHTNIINGIKPDWTDTSDKEGPLFAPKVPLQINPIELKEDDIKNSIFESFLRISLYFSWTELIEGLYKCWEVEDNGLYGNSGTLVVGEPSEAQIEKKISNKLGIKAEDANYSSDVGFALVMLRKSAASKTYSNISKNSLSNELKSALNSLPSDQVAVEPILEFLDNYGSHYVSALEVGDVIYQVFVYEKEVLTEIAKRYKPQELVSSASSSFRQFTQPKTKYSGYSKYAGNICVWSNDIEINDISTQLVDTVNNLKSSIFMILENETNKAMLNRLRGLVPISFKLKSLSTLMSTSEDSTFFDHVLRNALYQKYTTRINPQFLKVSEPFEYDKIYESFQHPFVSTISTSIMTINQIRVDLKDIVTKNPENVKLLFIFSDIVEVYDDVFLPGESVVIICRQFISHRSDSRAPEIGLTEKGCLSFNLYCRGFDGTMIVKNAKTGEHKLIFNGKTMKSVILANNQLSVANDVSHIQSPPLSIFDQLGDRLLNLLNLPLLSAQNIINYQTNDQSLEAAKLFTQWLADILEPAGEDRPIMVDVRTQAMLLLKSIKNSPGKVLSVPYLTYLAYKPSIDAMMDATDAFYSELRANTIEIQLRKNDERSYKTEQELNKNIQEMGKFLIAQNQALADHEQDIIKYHDDVNDKQNEMLNSAADKVTKLLEALSEQQQVVDDSYETLKECINIYIAEQAVKAALEVATAVASMFIGGYSLKNLDNIGAAPQDVLAIQKVLKKVDSTMKIIDGISKLINNIGSDVRIIKTVNNALSNVPDGTELPTTVEWNEFDASVFAVIMPITGTIPYANTYLKETKILSARGRAWIDACSEVTKLQYDILLNDWQNDVSKNQEKRLNDLSNTLNQPDLTSLEASSIDLFEIGSVYQSHVDRIVLKLVKTLGLQDAALQYYYLQAPTSITDYNILSIKETIVSQAENSITALESFNPKPSNFVKPIEYNLKGISINQIISSTDTPDTPIDLNELSTYTKDGVDFAIPISVSEFINYVRVRVDKIAVIVQGIKSTNSGKLNIHLTAYADPYFDRGLKRETLEFTSIQQEFDYVYDLTTGECIFGNQPSGEFAKYYMKMTPFTRWRLTLPMGTSSENQGIIFSGDTVDIKLSFYGEAIRINNI